MTDRPPLLPRADLPWRVLLVLGLVFLVVSGTDLAMLWLPGRLGVPEWEYGTSSAFFDSFPMFGIGLLLLGAGARALGYRWLELTVIVLAVLTAVFMWLVAALYATVAPLVFKMAHDPVALTPLKKAAVKTAVQAVVYPLALLWLAAGVLRRPRRL